ncbi:hypothetical protein GQ457_07G003200 [Hibiscus cannabinus]
MWFPLHIPKHSLVSWMVVLDRLPTADRLCRFGIMVDSVCKLCRAENESRNHLFFGCSFSQGIWLMVLRCYGIDRAIIGWEEEISWAIARLRGKSMRMFVLRLAWNVFMYSIWEERNRRIFCSIERDANAILSVIQEVIQVQIQKKNYRRDTVNRVGSL